jgi:hypothetical protein
MADMYQTAGADQFRRKALLGELGVNGEPGNTGIAGTPDVSQLSAPPQDPAQKADFFGKLASTGSQVGQALGGLVDPIQKAQAAGKGGSGPGQIGLALGGMPDTASAPAMPASPLADAPAAAPQRFNTKLMEGDPGKLADLAHAAKSPKYDFLQLAQKGTHNYDDLGGMLKELQGGPNARLWNGWSANKDKLTFGGDPSQLAPEWNGAKSVDAIGAYGDFANGGDAKGFRWGVGDEGGTPQGAQGAAIGGAPALGGMDLDNALNGDPLAKIKEAIAAMSAGRPNAAALMQQLGGGQ